MTTLAYDGTYLYADSQITIGDLKEKGRKIHRVKSEGGPVLVALAGDYSQIERVLATVKAGEDLNSLIDDNSCVFLLDKTGLRICSGGKTWRESGAVFAGSGEAAARGAYSVSRNVLTSCQAAAKVDLYSCLPVVRAKI